MLASNAVKTLETGGECVVSAACAKKLSCACPLSKQDASKRVRDVLATDVNVSDVLATDVNAFGLTNMIVPR